MNENQAPPLSEAVIAELTWIEKAATPGPWAFHLSPQSLRCRRSTEHLKATMTSDRDDDIMLAMTARNALPYLLAELAADKRTIERLKADVDERTKAARYITCCLGGTGDSSPGRWDRKAVRNLFAHVCRTWPWCDPRKAEAETKRGDAGEGRQ